MLDLLNELDIRLFLFLNGMHSAFFDVLMYWASDRFVWIPLYILMVYFIFRTYKWNGIKMLLLLIVLIVISDQVSAHVIKTLVHRFRPCHNMFIAAKIHLLNNHCGGKYGFVSSHASSSFAFATFVSLLLNSRMPRIKYILAGYALLISYSRIYLGVHYPGDVFCGAMFGALLGYLMYLISLKVNE
jgi:undecaprenyl-diphosphatase